MQSFFFAERTRLREESHVIPQETASDMAGSASFQVSVRFVIKNNYENECDVA